MGSEPLPSFVRAPGSVWNARCVHSSWGHRQDRGLQRTGAIRHILHLMKPSLKGALLLCSVLALVLPTAGYNCIPTPTHPQCRWWAPWAQDPGVSTPQVNTFTVMVNMGDHVPPSTRTTNKMPHGCISTDEPRCFGQWSHDRIPNS